MSAKISIDKKRIALFCQRWKVIEFALFGSVVRDDFGPDSDVDVLVNFQPGHGWTLIDMVTMHEELEEIFGRSVDLLTRRGVEQCRNPYRKLAILSSVEVVHAA